jgi:Domain of unknown function (DUF4314)
MDFFEGVNRPAPETPGTRIRLLAMGDDPNPVPAGSEGTVFGGNGAQLFVKWDNGRTLILLPGTDTYTVIGKKDA